MDARAGRTAVPTTTALLLGALLACAPAAAGAQEAAPASEGPGVDAERVELSTVGTYSYYRPYARLELAEPAYVAVFEVEPGVGATMLYPARPWPQKLHMAGVHHVDLTGTRAGSARRAMWMHLSSAFLHRPGVVPRNHLVAVASDRPLRLDELLSGRVFEHRHGYAGAGEVTVALLASVTRGLRPEAWASARSSYWKFRDRDVLAVGADVPWLIGGIQFLGARFLPEVPFFSFRCPWRWNGHPADGWARRCGFWDLTRRRLAHRGAPSPVTPDPPRDAGGGEEGEDRESADDRERRESADERDRSESTDDPAVRARVRQLLSELADAGTDLDRSERVARTLGLVGAEARRTERLGLPGRAGTLERLGRSLGGALGARGVGHPDRPGHRGVGDRGFPDRLPDRMDRIGDGPGDLGPAAGARPGGAEPAGAGPPTERPSMDRPARPDGSSRSAPERESGGDDDEGEGG